MTPFGFFLFVVAVQRLTQLIGHDRITGRLYRWRLTKWLYRRAGHEVDDPDQWGDMDVNPAKWDQQVDTDVNDGAAPDFAVGLRCWWCATIWSAAVLGALREAGLRGWIADDWYRLSVIVLAGSTGAVIVAKLVDVIVAAGERLSR